MNEKELNEQVLEESALSPQAEEPQKKPRTRKKKDSQPNKDSDSNVKSEIAKEENEEKKAEASPEDEDIKKEVTDAPEDSKNVENETEIAPVESDTAEISEEFDFSGILTLSSLSFEPIAEISEDEEPLEDEERIVPPDEIFAYRAKVPMVEDNNTVAEESIEEDGQYTLSDLEPEGETTEEEEEEEYAPKEQEAEPEKYDPEKPRRVDGRFDIVELFVFTLLAVMIITSFIFRHSIVEGHSMEDTLSDGDHLIISDLFYTPERGDIIVCEDYTTAISNPIVKRVIAVAGDTIEITESGEIYVNDVLLVEDYVYTADEPGYTYTPLEKMTIPEGEIFVMGDHRNRSTDSREIGTVSVDSVLGKVLLRFYPFDKFGTVD